MYVYKSCGDYIVTLEKLVDTIDNEHYRVVHGARDKCLYRANKLRVIDIEHKYNSNSGGAKVTRIECCLYDCGKNIHFRTHLPFENDDVQYGVYEVGGIVQVVNFGLDLKLDYTPGIWYYLNKQVAIDSEMSTLLEGPRTTYTPSGEFVDTCWYKAGKFHRVSDEDLPAVVTSFYSAWYKDGEYWRPDENSPCVVLSSGKGHSSRTEIELRTRLSSKN